MQSNDKMKFKKHATGIGRHLSLLQKGSLLALALTSCFVLNQFGQAFFSQYLSNTFLIAALSVAGIYLILLSTDLALGKFFPWVTIELFKSDFHQQPKRRKIFSYILLGVTVLQLVTTVSLTTMSRNAIAQSAAGDAPNAAPLSDATKTRKDQFSIAAKALEDDIENAKRTEKQRIQAAKVKGHSKVHKALYSKGAKMADLVMEGNSWALFDQGMKKAIEEAEADSAAIVAEAMTLVGDLNRQRTQFIAESTKADAAYLSPLQKIADDQATDYLHKKGNISLLVGYAAYVWAFLFIITTILHSLYVTSVTDDPQDGGDAVTLGYLVAKVWAKLSTSFINVIDDVVGNVTPRKIPVTDSGSITGHNPSVTHTKPPVSVPSVTIEMPIKQAFTASRPYRDTPKPVSVPPVTQETPQAKKVTGKVTGKVVARNGIVYYLEMSQDGTEKLSSYQQIADRIRKKRQRLNTTEELMKVDDKYISTYNKAKLSLDKLESIRAQMKTLKEEIEKEGKHTI